MGHCAPPFDHHLRRRALLGPAQGAYGIGPLDGLLGHSKGACSIGVFYVEARHGDAAKSFSPSHTGLVPGLCTPRELVRAHTAPPERRRSQQWVS